VALRATSDKVSEIVEKQSIASTQSSWTDDLKWKGDFRYRYEDILVEDQANRDRNRIRGRIAMIATLLQNVEVDFGMAIWVSKRITTVFRLTLNSSSSSSNSSSARRSPVLHPD